MAVLGSPAPTVEFANYCSPVVISRVRSGLLPQFRITKFWWQGVISGRSRMDSIYSGHDPYRLCRCCFRAKGSQVLPRLGF